MLRIDLIHDGSTKTRTPESGNGNGNGNGITEWQFLKIKGFSS